MAKEKKKKSQENAPVPSFVETVRLLFGLLFVVLSVYTVIALLSYLFTWVEDQSLLTRPDVWSAIVPVENGGGKLGFFWANLLISKLFGLGAFVFPLFFFSLGVYCLKLKRVNLVRVSFLTIYGAIIISLLFSFILGFTPMDDWFGNGAGGSYGYFVNRWLIAMLGATGAGSLVVLLFLIWLIVINKSLVHWINRTLFSLFSFSGKRAKKEAKANLEAQERAEQIVEEQEVTEEAPTEQEEIILEGEVVSAPVTEPSQPQFYVRNADGSEVRGDELLHIAEEQQRDDHESEANQTEIYAREVAFEIEEPEEEDFLKELSAEAIETLFDPRLDLSRYKAPTTDLLNDYRDKIYKVPTDELERNNRKIVKTLGDYKISVEKIYARTGPTVTLYEIVPSAGVRISQIKRLEDDIALSLAARGVRIIAPIPGTNAVGIEVANSKPSIVPMKSLLDDPKFRESNFELPVVIGRTISNEPMMFDLAKMPHLLVAGATGQGKSVGLNAIIASLLYTKHPSEMKMVLIDPKKVELSLYSKIERHFLAKLPDTDDPIITDTQKVIYTLKSLTVEMDARYDLLKAAKVRNLKEYNEKFLSRKLNPLKGHRYMHFIVVVIDEFADLLMTAGREIEEPIVRLAQLARAIGIHLVIATQRPTTNIITGLIKANFPARIAFRVISNIDSRTILETTGANQLVGRGDMLISVGGEITRVQCAFIDTPEVERITDYISNQQGYPSAHFLPEYTGEEGDASSVGDVDLGRRDQLFAEAAKLVVQYQQGSTSLIQRRMNLGYNRAGRIMDQLEAAGIVGPSEGSKARQVLISDFLSLDRLLDSLG